MCDTIYYFNVLLVKKNTNQCFDQLDMLTKTNHKKISSKI